jgi:hypothetical protein
MGWVAAVVAGLQLLLLLFTKWFQYGDEKQKERDALYDQGKKAIADRDVSKLNAVLGCIKRL